jgi:hypothetical protein
MFERLHQNIDNFVDKSYHTGKPAAELALSQLPKTRAAFRWILRDITEM